MNTWDRISKFQRFGAHLKGSNILSAMEASSSFTELIVWQRAHQFTLSVYALTRHFPKEEIYSLTSQFRRAAVSVAANIAEGYARRGKADKIKFFNYAQGSLQECKYYALLSKDLRYASDADMDAKIEEVSKLLAAYIRGIERRKPSFLLSPFSFLLSLFS